MKLRRKSSETDEATEPDKLELAHPSTSGAVIVKPLPEVTARVADNGRDVAVTFTGWGQGGHRGSLRAVGNGVDRTIAVQWDGDTYATTIEGGAAEVIAKIGLKSERTAPVVPLGR